MAKRTCSIPGCDRQVAARGWCAWHYQNRPGRPLCSIDGCERVARGRGWCGKHYQRWCHHGTTDLMAGSTEDRFWSKVNKNGPLPAPHTLAAGKGPCWLWTAYLDRDGYSTFGAVSLGGIRAYGHRLSYLWAYGDIPEGFQVDHLCRVRSCVNPAHLEAVTGAENTRRSWVDREHE